MKHLKVAATFALMVVLLCGVAHASSAPPLLTKAGWFSIQKAVWSMLGAKPTDEVTVLLQGRLKSNPDNALLRWCATILKDRSQHPQWKVMMAEKAVLGQVGRFDAELTHYQPANIPGQGRHYDKLGGQGRPAWAAHLGNRYARYGDIAACRQRPFGQVIFIGHLRQIFIVVDRGGKVSESGHLDVCVPPAAWYETRSKWGTKHTDAWVLGQVEAKYAK